MLCNQCWLSTCARTCVFVDTGTKPRESNSVLLVPSGEITTGPAASSFISRKSVFSGAGIDARTSTAEVDDLDRKKIVPPRAAINRKQAAASAFTVRFGVRALAALVGLPADRCNTKLKSSAEIFSSQRTYYFSSMSQFVTKTTGAVLSVMEFNTRNRPSRDTS